MNVDRDLLLRAAELLLRHAKNYRWRIDYTKYLGQRPWLRKQATEHEAIAAELRRVVGE